MVSIHNTNAYKNSIYNITIPEVFNSDINTNSVLEYIYNNYTNINIKAVYNKLNTVKTSLKYEIFIPNSIPDNFNIRDYIYEGKLNNSNFVVLSMNNNLIEKVNNNIIIHKQFYTINNSVNLDNGNIHILN